MPEPLRDRVQPVGRPQRRAWRFIALGVIALTVVLCAVFAAPLLFDFGYRAPEGGQPVVQEGLTATPTDAATQQQVTLAATGLPAGAQVTIMAGTSQDEMRNIGTAVADPEGNLQAESAVPEWAERGAPFYFAVEVDGERVGTASVNVIVRDQVAPSGV